MLEMMCLIISHTVLTTWFHAVCLGTAAVSGWVGWRRAGAHAAKARSLAVSLVFVLVAAHAYVAGIRLHVRSVDAKARRTMERVVVGMPLQEADALLGRHVDKFVLSPTVVRYVFRRLAGCDLLCGPPSYSIRTDGKGLIVEVRALERD